MQAGSTFATSLLTSLGEAGAFPPPVSFLHDNVSHAPFSTHMTKPS